MLMKNITERGETIVEVLIALSILGLMLGIGYASSGDSLRTSRDTQERVEAYQIAQGVMETVRYISKQSSYENNPFLFPPGQAGTNGGQREFCVTDSLSDLSQPNQAIRNRPGGASPSIHQECFRGPDGRYSVWVDANRLEGNGAPISAGNTTSVYVYTVNVEWESLNGNTSEVQLRYKRKIIND